MESELVLWQPESGELLPPEAKTAVAITDYAQQLSNKDKKQISAAFENKYYEMGMNFLWSRTVAALKQELSNVGVSLIGEMLGKSDVDESDDIDDVLTTKEAIRLAEELGVVSSTDALRLRHTNEIISHFSQLSTSENDSEQIDESEAISSLKACVKAVLGKPRVEVAAKFIEFRSALDKKIQTEDDGLVRLIAASPYFFQKLSISILVNVVKQSTGAQLEIALANINILLPALWDNLRKPERWQVGHAYAELYSEGKTTAVSGIKSALSKVKGFDYVPESLRSDTFLKAANAIINAHEGLNNFYNEYSPLKALSKLGTTIPTPALGECITAILCVRLGNSFGTAWNAQPLANELLKELTPERWQYYLNQVLPGDLRILNKLGSNEPMKRWFDLVEKYEFGELNIKNKEIKYLITASEAKNENRVDKTSTKLIDKYYGRH